MPEIAAVLLAAGKSLRFRAEGAFPFMVMEHQHDRRSPISR